MENVQNGLGHEALLSAAYDRVSADLQQLKPEDFQPVTLDITKAVSTVLGVLPEVRALREEIVKRLPTFDIARFDKLEDYALALGFAQSKYLAATQPPDDLDELAGEASKLRERFLAEVKTLTHHKLISDAQLSNLKGANGKHNVATDLWVLAGLLQENWAKIQGRTFTTLADLEYGLRLATRVLRIVGQREQGPTVIAEATERRLRAYTQLMLAYEDTQLAVAYLRGNKYDADTIVPNLHPGRPGARRRQEEPTTIPEGSVPPPAPGSAPGAPSTAGSAPAAPGAAGSIAANGPFVS